MASFYKLTASELDAIIQLDKRTQNSLGKYFAHSTVRMKLEFDPATGTPVALFTRSFPLDSENVMIKSIDVQREIMIVDTAGTGLSLLNPEIINMVLPGFKVNVFVGLSDQDTSGVATVYDLNSYVKNNSVSIPCILSGNNQSFHLEHIGEQFNLKKNKGFLNIFVMMTMIDTGDVTNYLTFANNTINAVKLNIGALNFDFYVNISGRLI